MKFLHVLRVAALLSAATPVALRAQSLTQNAEGASTILFKGSQATVNIGAKEASFGLNNLNRAVELRRPVKPLSKPLGKNQPKPPGKKIPSYQVVSKNGLQLPIRGIFGLSASVKSEDELRNLVTAGEFVPSAQTKAFAGFSLSNALLPSIEASRGKLLDQRTKLAAEAFRRVEDTVVVEIKKLIAATPADKNALTVFQEELFADYSEKKFSNEMETLLKADAKDVALITATKVALLKAVKAVIADIEERRKNILSQERHLTNEYAAHTFFHLIAYGFVSGKATQFKRFVPGPDTVKFNKYFNDVNFRGGQIGLGLNYQVGWFTLGIQYSRADLNNFDDLSKKEYTLRTTSTQGTQTLVDEKKITAYAGDYATTKGSLLNADLLFNVDLDHSAKFHALINPYVRYRVANNAKLLPETIDLGSGLYFYKRTGKFVGGIYAELPDIKNNIEKHKPEDEQELRKPWQRLAIGIVASVSINSLLDTF